MHLPHLAETQDVHLLRYHKTALDPTPGHEVRGAALHPQQSFMDRTSPWLGW